MKTTRFFFSSLLAVLSWLNVQPSLAHSTEGLPYLSINGTFVQENPLTNELPNQEYQLGLDSSPEVYLVNQPLSFVIDQTRLQVTDDIWQASSFRWTWDEGAVPTDTGPEITHQYSSIGSHLVTLELKTPGSSEFEILNTLWVDVVSDINYTLPTVFIYLVADEGQTQKTGDNLSFYAKVTNDPSTSITTFQWDFGKGRLTSGQTTYMIFPDQDFFSYITLRVKDSNGFVAHDGTQVGGTQGVITFFQPPDGEGLPTLTPFRDAVVEADKSSTWGWIIGGLGVVLCIGLGVLVFRHF